MSQSKGSFIFGTPYKYIYRHRQTFLYGLSFLKTKCLILSLPNYVPFQVDIWRFDFITTFAKICECKTKSVTFSSTLLQKLQENY